MSNYINFPDNKGCYATKLSKYKESNNMFTNSKALENNESYARLSELL